MFVFLIGTRTNAFAQDIPIDALIQQNQSTEVCGAHNHSPQPQIVVNLRDNHIILRNWFFTPTIDLYINQGFIGTRYVSQGGAGFSPTSQILPGDMITLSSGGLSISYTVGVLSVASYDETTRVLRGTAEPGVVILTITESPEGTFSVMVGADKQWAFALPNEIDIVYYNTVLLDQYDQNGNTTSNRYRIGNPIFTIFHGENRISGSFWQKFTQITVQVNQQVLGTALTNGEGYFNFYAEQNFVAGDVVRLSGGGQSIDYTVKHLSVDSIDLGNNFVAGKASPGSLLVSDRALFYGMVVTVDPNGDWQADFSESPPWTNEVNGYIQQCQPAGHCEHLPWFNPLYRMIVDPELNQVEAFRWQPNSNLLLTIGSRTFSAMTDITGYARFETGSEDITFGSLVQLTDGTTTKTHTVKTLAITNTNPVSRLITGNAAPGTKVLIRKSSPYNDPWKEVSVNAAGNWELIFSDEIYPETIIYVKQTDADVHATQVIWKLENASIWAYPKQNKVLGRNWIPGSSVRLAIGNRTWTNTVDSSGLVEFLLEDFYLQPNQQISMTNSIQNQSYQIRDLSISSAKQYVSLLSGRADSNPVAVKACAPIYYGCFFRTVSTNPSGDWQADFSGDLVFNPEYYGSAYLYDHLLNATVVDWEMHSYPAMTVVPWMSMVSSYGWGSTSLVSLLIDNVEIIKDQPAVDGSVNFHNIPAGLLVPDAVVTLKDQNTRIDLLIGSVELALIDPLSDSVIGTSDGSDVSVNACSRRCETMTVSPSYDPDSGKSVWVANFAGRLDLTPNSFGSFWIANYGNRILYHWRSFDLCHNYLPAVMRTH